MNVFMGFEFEARPEWRTIMGDPKKPANWKDDTYKSKIEELRLKQAEDASTHLAAGVVSRACAIVDNNTIITGTGVEVLSELCDGTHRLGVEPGHYYNVFGFETLDALRQLGWCLLAAGRRAPHWLWNSGLDFINWVTLVNLYTCSGARDIMSVDQMIAHWLQPDANKRTAAIIQRLRGSSGLKPEDGVITPAENMAAAALIIATHMGLVPEEVSAHD